MSNVDHIIVPQIKRHLEHHADQGWPDAYEDRLWWLGDDLVPGATLFITSRSVIGLEPHPAELVDLHEHPVPQVYLVMGSPRFVVEATLGDERTRVESPATIHVPAGVPHALHFVEGTGTLVAILQDGQYVGTDVQDQTKEEQ